MVRAVKGEAGRRVTEEKRGINSKTKGLRAVNTIKDCFFPNSLPLPISVPYKVSIDEVLSQLDAPKVLHPICSTAAHVYRTNMCFYLWLFAHNLKIQLESYLNEFYVLPPSDKAISKFHKIPRVTFSHRSICNNILLNVDHIGEAMSTQ